MIYTYSHAFALKLANRVAVKTGRRQRVTCRGGYFWISEADYIPRHRR